LFGAQVDAFPRECKIETAGLMAGFDRLAASSTAAFAPRGKGVTLSQPVRVAANTIAPSVTVTMSGQLRDMSSSGSKKACNRLDARRAVQVQTRLKIFTGLQARPKALKGASRLELEP
jgi:hypothetical protein